MCQYKPLPRTLHNSDNAPHTTLPHSKRASSFGYPIKLKWAGKARPFQGFAPQNAWCRHAASGLTPGGSFPMCQYKPLPRTLHNSDNAPHTTPATSQKSKLFWVPDQTQMGRQSPPISRYLLRKNTCTPLVRRRGPAARTIPLGIPPNITFPPIRVVAKSALLRFPLSGKAPPAPLLLLFPP